MIKRETEEEGKVIIIITWRENVYKSRNKPARHPAARLECSMGNNREL